MYGKNPHFEMFIRIMVFRPLFLFFFGVSNRKVGLSKLGVRIKHTSVLLRFCVKSCSCFLQCSTYVDSYFFTVLVFVSPKPSDLWFTRLPCLGNYCRYREDIIRHISYSFNRGTWEPQECPSGVYL